MIDREKAIMGLGEILVYCHEQFGENDHDVQAQLTRMNQTAKDAIELLKAQEPRVMTLEEVKYSSDPVWLEWRYGYIKPAFLHSDQITTEDCRNAITFTLFGSDEWYIFADDDYGKEIRCWTSRPDDKRRAETPWE